jgi:hypothetical protein
VPTTYLALLNATSTGQSLPAASWNKMTEAQDRGGGQMMAALFVGGVKAGWSLTSGASTISSGNGQVGPCWCVTGAAQAISGLVSGSTNYVFAKTNGGSPASGTISFVARATSTTIANTDGVTSAVILGKGTYVAGTGLKTLSSALRKNWRIDHGALGGLSDDDHPDYMRPLTVSLFGEQAVIPATSAASTSSYGTNFKATAVKFPALSTTKAGWNYYCPSDYSGTITLYCDWISSGLAGKVRLSAYARNRASGESADGALTSCFAETTITPGGSNGNLVRTSHAWTATKPSADERGTIAIRRVGASASDTMSGAMRLLSARIKFYTAR